MTLRARFALWICLMMLATLGAFGAFVYFSVSHWLSSSLDDSLRLGATQLIATADVDDGKLQVDDDPVILDAGLTDELRSRGLSIQIFGPSGAVLQSLGPYASLAVEPAVLREALAGRSSLHTRPDPEGTGSVRVLTQPMLIDGKVGAVIQIAESVRSIDALRERLLLSLLLGSPMIVAAAFVFGQVFSGRGAFIHVGVFVGTMTANAFSEDREQCFAAGMNDFVAKPVDPVRLFATLLKWLARAKPAPESGSER